MFLVYRGGIIKKCIFYSVEVSTKFRENIHTIRRRAPFWTWASPG